MNKTIKILSIIVIFLLSLECYLMIEGSIRIFSQSLSNSQQAGDDITKILCIGDSITAQGGDKSYPQQLDQILNQQLLHEKVKVLIEARSGMTTKDVATSLSDWIEKYDPEIVVLIIGANDYKIKDDQQRVINNFRVYRLLKNLGRRFVIGLTNVWPIYNFVSLENDQDVPSDIQERVDLAQEKRAKGNLKEAQTILEELSVTVSNHKAAQLLIHQRLGQVYLAQAKVWDFLRVVEYVFLYIDERDYNAEKVVLDFCKYADRYDFGQRFIKRLISQKPDSIAFHELMIRCQKEAGANDQVNTYQKRVNELKQKHQNVNSQRNYLSIVELLQNRGIKTIIAQYPLIDIYPLKEIFREDPYFSDIYFVDNTKRYMSLVQENGYDVYFNDTILVESGHGTDEGNRILAENISEEVLKIMSE